MKTILAALVIFLIHCGSATLVIRGPSGPVLEGEYVTVECLLKDSEYNISDVQIQYFDRFEKEWTVVRVYYSLVCISYPLRLWRTEDRIILGIRRASGSYNLRCVIHGTNATYPDYSTEPLNFTAYSAPDLSWPHLSRVGISRYFSFPRTLRVRAGDDVVVNCSATSSEEPNIFWSKEGSDWILPSSVLTLKNVSAFDEGEYTCSAQHPTFPSLRRRRSFTVTILSDKAPVYQYQNSGGHLFMMTLMAPVIACLLLVILGVSVCLCHRAKKIRTSKGPIDDHSQKKPIYKSSSEPLPITCGDNKPLLV